MSIEWLAPLQTRTVRVTEGKSQSWQGVGPCHQLQGEIIPVSRRLQPQLPILYKAIYRAALSKE